MLAAGSFASATAGPQPTTTGLTATVSGNVVSLTATVSSATAAPTGTVVISVNGTSGDALPLTPATATSSTAASTLTLRPSDTPYTLVATYKTDSFDLFVNSSSPPVQVLIPLTTHQASTTSLTIAPSAPLEGGTLTLSSTVTGGAGRTPTGTVTFATVGSDGTTHFLAQADLVNGATSVDVPGWVAGTYVIQASYGGDSVYAGSASPQQTVTVAPVGSLKVDTTTTIAVTPNPVPNDGVVTIAAHVEQTATHGPPAGNAVTFYATRDGGVQVNIGEAPLLGGVATLVKAGWLAGHYTIEADYFGSQTDKRSLATAPLDVTAPSVLTLATPSAQTGQPVTLSATLTDGALQPLAGRAVTLSFGRDGDCAATTDVGGNASCTIPNVVESAGPATAVAAFPGDTTYSPSTASAATTIQAPAVPIGTALSYVGDAFAPPGTPATIAFKLTTAGGTVLPAHVVTVVFDGTTYTLTTDSHGVASTTVTSPAAAGPHVATASFAGDASYGSSTGAGTLISSIPTALSYVGDASVFSTGDAVLKAKLVSTLDSSPVVGVQVTLALATGESCVAITDKQGMASCTKRIDEPAGNDAVTLTFAGGGIYLGSTGSGTLTVNATDTTVVLAQTPPTLQGTSATLRATLTSTETGRPLAVKTVTLALGAQSCTAVTNAAGIAVCTIGAVSAPVGYDPTSATFAGDATAKKGSATGTTLVYQLAPGGGMFVVGDRSATGNVTFWGAQWAKLNSLSRSSAPDAFKGFAEAAVTQCGATWTTRPGNSTPPPAGPLPAYMAVIVSSSIGKAGSTISGDVVRIVVVKTAPGYAADPGHAGTGTVVATVCPAG